MEGDELPDTLKSVLKRCFPVGIAKIEGDYKSEERSAAAGGDSRTAESQDDDTIALLNKRNVNNWQVYLKDSD
jgi:hypothetical protein